jgi:transcription-repair coupling factor (superfamily II helicase)
MTYRKDKTLSEIASKRLQSIKEFTKFGSGFKIAMRDLQVRGAGNLLGANEHGHFHNVGYEMYCRLLAEAVAEEQGETVKHVRETEIDLAVNAFLPKEYIPSEQQRTELYKTIAAVETEEDRDRVTEELIDVYADPPQSVLNLLEIAVTKAYAQQAGIAKIRQTDRLVSVEYFSDSVLDFERLQSLGKTYRLKLRPNTSVPTLLLSLPKDAEPLPFVSDLIKNLISISLPMQYNDTM